MERINNKLEKKLKKHCRVVQVGFSEDKGLVLDFTETPTQETMNKVMKCIEDFAVSEGYKKKE